MRTLNKISVIVLSISTFISLASGCNSINEGTSNKLTNSELEGILQSLDETQSESGESSEKYVFEEYSASYEEKQNNEYKYWLHKRDDYFKREEFVEIIEYLGSDTDIKIPSLIDGVPVRKVGNGKDTEKSAFPEKIKSVEIPDTVYVIGDFAFYNTEIERVTIPESVVKIEDYAFNECENLKGIIIPSKIETIGSYAFMQCSDEKALDDKLVLPESLKELGRYAFAHSHIKGVVIPDTIDIIPKGCFCNCKELQNVVLGKNTTSISESAFYGNKSLTKIEFPDTVEYIGETAFNHCSLETLVLPSNVGLGKRAFANNLFTEIIIPEGTEFYFDDNGIEGSQFEFCDDLVKVTVNSEYVSSEMFCNCKNLSEVYLSDKVKKIYKRAFSYDMIKPDDIEVEIHIPSTVTEIEEFDRGESIHNSYIIYGKKGSQAEIFANKYKIPFVEE